MCAQSLCSIQRRQPLAYFLGSLLEALVSWVDKVAPHSPQQGDDGVPLGLQRQKLSLFEEVSVSSFSSVTVSRSDDATLAPLSSVD